MLRLIKRLWARLTSRNAVPKKKRRKKVEKGSAAYYLGDLLDNLDSLFADFSLLRLADPDVYALTRKWGATTTNSEVIAGTTIEPHFLVSLPTFGCFHLPANDDGKSDMVPCRFLYFVKEKRPVNVQGQVKVIGRPGSTIYRCGAIFSWRGHPALTQFYVSVSKDSIAPLKVCSPRHHSTGSRNQPIIRMEWGYPRDLIDYASDNDKTPEELVVQWFSVAANFAFTREAGLTVTASKRQQSAAFSIDMLRTPYFFADRQKTVNENGRTKVIIHHVRGHWRTLAGGQRKFIKPHFRGLREFLWNGYQVRVGMAGWHGIGLSSLNVASADERASNEDFVNAEEVAEKIDRLLA